LLVLVLVVLSLALFSEVRLLGSVGVDDVVCVEVLVELQVECLGSGPVLR
jgi:hypothetical protein